MKPVSPVIPGMNLPEIVFAKDQPEYQPLPAFRNPDGNIVLCRWKMNWFERIRVLWTGSIWVQLMTFGKPLTPTLLTVKPPEFKE